MEAPTVTALLQAWETGLSQTPAQRALTLLAAATPDESVEALAALSVGRRDARLLALREWLFGSRLDSLASCEACGEPLELTFQVGDIWVAGAAEPVETISVTVDEYDVEARLPTSLDLTAIVGSDAAEAGRRLLLDRVLIGSRRAGAAIPADDLPDPVVAAVVDHLAQADPQADVQLALACPSCGHTWTAIFDIVSFLWSDLESWARCILRDVHHLATAYGWSEGEILRMSPWRRRLYLDMVPA